MKTFSNDNIEVNGVGFVPVDSVETTSISDHVGHNDYRTRNKIATSIPSAFARMFLFNTALKEITSMHEAEGDENIDHVAHDKNPIDENNAPNVYHYIISEHLDLLEFIFLKADTDDLNIWVWEREEMNKLLKDSDLGIVREALNSAIQDSPSLFKLPVVRMFVFKKQLIIGGTSPQSLVYTNPNWARFVESENPKGLEGLFNQSTARPLHDHNRNINFRKLLKLQLERGDFDDEQYKYFKLYLIQSFNDYDSSVRSWYEDIEAPHKDKGESVLDWADDEINKLAHPIKDQNKKEVQIQTEEKRIYLYSQNKVVKDFSSDYVIHTTTNEFKKELAKGRDEELGNPVLIVPTEILNFGNYCNGTKWSSSFQLPMRDELKKTPLSKRELPGTGVLYPYITEDDLFEPNIIELAYCINDKRFYTGANVKIPFILPLKKNIFKFYTLEDVKKMVSIKCTEKEGEYNSVTISLKIPMKKLKKPIEISREYKENGEYGIVNCRNTTSSFNIGFFPFFRLKNDNSNIYNVMIGSTSQIELSTKFYKFGDMSNEIAYESYKNRTTGSVNTKYIRIRSSFDVIEVKINESSMGLIIPNMGENIVLGTKQYVFAVDFGTDNTHVAYADAANIAATTKALDIIDSDEETGTTKDKRDVQVVFLNADEKNNRFKAFELFAKREFPPISIGQKGSIVKFPIRTAVYEVRDLSERSNLSLFNDINIGFNYSNEFQEQEGNIYQTDLKWNLFDLGLTSSRTNAYCEELLWLIRNKVLLNGGSDNFKLFITYPQVMSGPKFDELKRAWLNAWRALGRNENEIEDNFKLESVAPYLKLRHEGISVDDVYVNIDIGGGSTDILYINPNTKIKPNRSYSAFFAADDLWGTGCDSANKESKDNGFVMSYEKLTRQLSTNQKTGMTELKDSNYKNFKYNVARNAKDVIGHLFATNDTQFIELLRHHPLLIVHFSAIIYYLAVIIKDERLKIPYHISFTGMGSNYLDYISGTPENIANLINVIFDFVINKTGEGTSSSKVINIKISHVKNAKQVTAEGAVYYYEPNNNLKVFSPRFYAIGDEPDEPFNVGEILPPDDFNPDEYNEECIKGDSIMEKTIRQYLAFTKLLNNPDFKAAATQCIAEYNYDSLKKAGIADIKLAISSYRAMAKTMSHNSMDQRFNEPLFFWPIKNLLYEVAKKIEIRTA